MQEVRKEERKTPVYLKFKVWEMLVLCQREGQQSGTRAFLLFCFVF